MTTSHASIDQHPDILALRASYDRAAESMTAQATFGLTLLTAIYVALSPHIVGFDGFTRLPANDLVVGITVAVLAMCFGSALDRTHGMTWTLPIFGLWLIGSPWIFVASPTAGMIWSHVICGLLITVFGLYAVYFGMRVRDSGH
jgi:SPW repeat